MYTHNQNQMIMPEDFFLPFEGQLNADNRWVRMASLIPWAEVESEYIKQLGDTNQGSRANSARLALGALIIKEKLGLSDIETVETVTENPYMQYFLGLEAFKDEPPFDDSSMTHFRKRFDAAYINTLNERMLQMQRESSSAEPSDTADSPGNDDDHPDPPPPPASGANDGQSKQSSPNQGKLMLDATCAPADIQYPTDLRLLNTAREKLEAMIDTLHAPFVGQTGKPRTYRKKARKQYLAVAKQRRPGIGKVRQGIHQQLGYVGRNLKHVTTLADKNGLTALSPRQYRDLLVIQELHRQQSKMFEENSAGIDDRIVSIRQPHVRPIVRGKMNAPVEFGAKLSVSLVNGYAFLDVLSWDSYHEGKGLQASVEQYKQRYGHYPEAVLADTIYRTRENRKYCQDYGIRLSGPKLGRPAKDAQINTDQKRIEYQDASERNAIEGKFGEGKRRYGLGRISACLQKTSETVISLNFLVMNIGKILRDSFFSFLFRFAFCFRVNHRIYPVIH